MRKLRLLYKRSKETNGTPAWKIKEMMIMSLLFKGCKKVDILNYDLQEAGLPHT